MKKIDAIKQMLGADQNTSPIKIDDELIFPWDINIDLKNFSDEQIETFYFLDIEDTQEVEKNEEIN